MIGLSKNLKCKIINNSDNYACFKIKNEMNSFPGLALTLGNTFRRILLNNILGTSITSYNINKPEKEILFTNGLKEDFFELNSNFKKIILKSKKITTSNATLTVKGPCIVTASDIKFNNNILLVNPHQYLFTIVNNITISINFFVEQGFGCKFYNEHSSFIKEDTNKILLDANFSPILKVNYKTTIENSTKTNIKLVEVLYLEIWTNGSITPKRAFFEASKISASIFSSFLM